MTTPAPKVPLYSLNDLKNTTDDSIAPYLTTLPAPYTLKQVHTYTDVRLALGYSAVAIGGAIFYADYKYGWDATKDATKIAVVVYFLLNFALTFWVWKVEKGRVFEGVRIGGQRLRLSTVDPPSKTSPTYSLSVHYSSPDGSKVWENKTITGPYTSWFNKDGFFVPTEFQAWLAREIQVIGLAEEERTKIINKEKVKQIVESGGAEVGAGDDGREVESIRALVGKTRARKGKK